METNSTPQPATNGRISAASFAKFVTQYHRETPPEETSGRRFDPWQSLRDLIDTLEAMPTSQQPMAASIMALTIATLAPHQLDIFLERLRASPVSAQTNTIADEALRFMGYNDRQE